MLDGTLGCDDIREGQLGKIIVFYGVVDLGVFRSKTDPQGRPPKCFVVACRLTAHQGLTLSSPLSATACRSRQLCHPT